MAKLSKPINPLIFQVAGEMAATTFEAMLSSGIPRGKYVGLGDKPVKMYVKDHIEKFIPIAISTLIDMLKPTSNCNEHMRQKIHEALTDPLNDPDLITIGKATKINDNAQDMLTKAIRSYDKNKIMNNIVGKPKSKKDLKSTTPLGG